jgi:hypothetical protein
MVEGSDPALKSEAVLFTAHWDHLGIGRAVVGDAIYNGAADNATGTALLLELARAWAARNPKPKRSALFLSVTAEEKGLLGSKYYAQHPVIPLGKTALDLNFDMILPLGVPESIVVTGAERTTAWPAVQAAARKHRLEIEPDSRAHLGIFYRSDHFSLARAGVPAFSIAAGTKLKGKPADYARKAAQEFNDKAYHTPQDEVRPEWDFAGFAVLAGFALDVATDVADADRLPTWNPGDEFRPARDRSGVGRADDPNLREQAAAGLKRAVGFYRTTVSTEGGYLWRYSDDLARREGEAKATATQAWVQPPGTPAVGLAYLAAYEATGDAYYLEAAAATARALVRGQLRSGGWDYKIEFDPNLRKEHAYRADGDTGGRNVTTLDDNTTQEAIRLLMRVDVALKQTDAAIHGATVFALDSLAKAQYPNGAWAQRYDTFPDPAMFPVKKASFPEAWPREYPAKDYRSYYTFNDNSLADAIDVMFEAEKLYGEPRYRAAATRAGDFILLAQLPEPQPGWAQQYDADMHPAWARKFEPPAVTGGEAQGVMLTLLRLYRETGDRKYLEPIPRALAYYRKSLLPDGRLARFYELKTNRPLYFTTDYKLTYADDDVPTHYAFKVSSRLDQIAREYERAKDLPPGGAKKEPAPPRGKPSPAQEAEVRAVLAALDEQGRWVENGRLKYHGPDDPTRRVIDSRTFVRNVGVLSRYLAATRP